AARPADAQIVTREDRRVPSAAEKAAALLQVGRDLLDLDRVRHVPIRVEHDLLHLVGEDRGLLVGFPGHDAGRVDRLAVLAHAQHEFRDIDRYIITPQIMGKPTLSLHVEQKRLDLRLAYRWSL